MLASRKYLEKPRRAPFGKILFLGSLFCAFLSLSFVSHAQGLPYTGFPRFKRSDRPPQGVQISENFRRGSHLIYDCLKRHYACVNTEGKELCRQWREESFRRGDRLFACAPLKSFETKEECHEKVYELIFRAASKGYCLNHHLESLQMD